MTQYSALRFGGVRLSGSLAGDGSSRVGPGYVRRPCAHAASRPSGVCIAARSRCRAFCAWRAIVRPCSALVTHASRRGRESKCRAPHASRRRRDACGGGRGGVRPAGGAIEPRVLRQFARLGTPSLPDVKGGVEGRRAEAGGRRTAPLQFQRQGGRTPLAAFSPLSDD